MTVFALVAGAYAITHPTAKRFGTLVAWAIFGCGVGHYNHPSPATRLRQAHERASLPSYAVCCSLSSLSASSSTTRTMPNTAWRIVAWPKARRLAASFGSSLRAGW